jgi:GrpB-like predicted nucleotidyltransferase (UPF0157 family)
VLALTNLGLESKQVRVVAYDASWPAIYAAEITRLTPALAATGVVLILEHTGSTAVPGLAAKPIIDILAGLQREVDRIEAVKAIQAAGYQHRGEQDIAGRDFFRRGEPRQFHLHLTTVGSEFWNDHRTFRDWLSVHKGAMQEYASLKQALAVKHPVDREAYIQRKTAFVEQVLQSARSLGER